MSAESISRQESGCTLSSSQLVLLLVDIVLIVVLAQAFGRIAERFGQPRVVGEILIGIIASPMVLGSTLSGAVFPSTLQPYLTAFANVGVAFFMFHAGLEIDPKYFRRSRSLVAGVALAAYVLPFVLGTGLALAVLSGHTGGNRVEFSLFLGAALAVTAFPVLARILDERGLLHSRVGQLSLAAAALNDLMAWIVLAVLIGLRGSQSGGQWKVLLVIPLIAGLAMARPLLGRALNRIGSINGVALAAMGGTLLCAAITEWIGLHVIFGAFAFGVVFPRNQRDEVGERIRMVSSLFVPAFFVVAGLHIDLSTPSWGALGELLLLAGAAVAGKLGGTYLAARLGGVGHREAGVLGSLMNARGLTELVILVLGLSFGFLDKQLYSLMVIVALVTTAMTTPLLKLFAGHRAEAATLTPAAVKN